MCIGTFVYLLLRPRRNCGGGGVHHSNPVEALLGEDGIVEKYGGELQRDWYDVYVVERVGSDTDIEIREGKNLLGVSYDVDLTNVTTRIMPTGEDTDDAHCKSSARLLRGDILVTRTKGHTVVVLSNGAKAQEEATPSAFKLGDRVLKNGSVGADVKQLQEALIRLGISCGDYGADGEFGDCTEMAVIAYQKQHALEPDGEYGPLTNASLTAELERLENPAQQNCVRIVGGNCYVRVQPNTDAEKLGVAHRDTLLPYQGEIAANGWLKVSFNGQDGWVSGKYGRICG